MFTKSFWMQATERAGKSAGQALLGAVLLSDTGFVNAFDLNYKLALGVALGGALLSYVTSVVSANIGQENDPSVVAKASGREWGLMSRPEDTDPHA